MKWSILFIFLSSSLVCLGLGCSSKAPNRPNIGGVGASDGSADNPTTEDTEMDGQAKALKLLPDDGSKMRFMDGSALTTIYGRIFLPEGLGFAHCAKDKPKDYDGCKIIFNRDERPAMGVFDLYSQRMDRGLQNVNKVENMTLNYVRNLRAALGRECERLVSNEEKALADNASAKTLIVKANAPTAEALESYFKKMMGAEGSDIDFEVPYASYVKAFQTAVASDPDKSKAKHNAYVNLCISISMEPQVFLY